MKRVIKFNELVRRIQAYKANQKVHFERSLHETEVDPNDYRQRYLACMDILRMATSVNNDKISYNWTDVEEP